MKSQDLESNKVSTAKTWYQKSLNIVLKTLMSFVGIGILSMGATLLRTSPILGLDPFTALNIGLSGKLGIPLGGMMACSNIIIFVFILFLDIHKIGIGTIMNMFFVGYEIQYFSGVYHAVFGSVAAGWAGAPVVAINLVLGLILFTAGSSLYMAPSLGVAPYDAIAPIASNLLHCQYKTARVCQDIIFLIAAVCVGGPVGIASIITAFFAGPLITFWDKHLSDPFVNAINDFSATPSVKVAAKGISKAAKSGYSHLSNAYNATVDTQMHLSGYTNEELSKRIHEAETNMNDSKKAYNAYRTQYRMLMVEWMKRNGKTPNGSDNSNNASKQAS